MQSVLNKQQGTTFLLYLALVAKNIQGRQLQDIKISCLMWAQHAPAIDFRSLVHQFFFLSFSSFLKRLRSEPAGQIMLHHVRVLARPPLLDEVGGGSP